MGKYINPFTDIGFKRIFGQDVSKPLLIDFLNNLLEGERHIVDLTLLDKEQLAEYANDRSLIYDIYCETDTGEKIVVEMQNRTQPYFKRRSIFYAAQALSRQGERGLAWHYDVKSVYLIAFLNFKQTDIGTDFRTDVAMMNMKNGEIFSDLVRLIYLQLPYFNEQETECDNDFKCWIYLLKNMETLARMPFAARNAVFERLAQIAEVASMTQAERLQYDESLRKYRDTIGVLEGARIEGLEQGIQQGLEQGIQQGIQQGLEQGREQGRAQGREEGKAQGREEGRAQGKEEGKAEANLAHARTLKELGVDINIIVKTTGLTIEEINAL